MTNSRHVFFDLDHTLWDFESNSTDTLHELFEKHQLQKVGMASVEAFISHYQVENDLCWADYRAGRMTREVLRIERFIRALARYDHHDHALAARLADDYVAVSPTKTRLMPGSLEVLDDARTKGYRLHILTNGFKEVQYIKLDRSGLRTYFEGIFTSEELGYNKPHVEAFMGALSRAEAKPEHTWMIGDSLEADVRGAHQAGLTTVLYHPNDAPMPEVPHFGIRHLEELKSLL